MYYSGFAPAGQAEAHEKFGRDIDDDIVAMIEDLPTYFPPIDCPIETPVEDTIGADNFATNPISCPKPEAMRTKGMAARHPSAPVTGTTPLPTPRLPHPSDTTSTPVDIRPVTSTKSTSKTPWRELGEVGKLQPCVEAAGRLDGLAWSLNFGIGREGALLAHDDPARLLSTYISRELRGALGRDLPYSFVFELVRDSHGFNRLHAHGVIVLDGVDQDLVGEALIRAGGKIEDRVWAGRQLDLRAITSASGWTSYITKMRRWGKATPSNRYVFNSRQMKAIARHDYAEHGLSRPIAFSKPRPK
ncbi:hypothetical protein [Mesorhizobium sp. M0771]|uniref:hypothetical protein n=1 Tax=Mesorhizobium sp. M0771 TaxID=2956997 RepID=UPI003335F7BF